MAAEKSRAPDEEPMIPASEVEAILQKAIATSQADMMARFEERLAAFQPQAMAGMTDKGAMEALAMAIAGVTDQEIGRRRVAPEEMARRIRAREAMEALITRTVEAGTQPVYKLTQKCFLGERAIEPYWIDRATRSAKATEVGWWGIPNEFMHPVNAEAEAIHALFLESIDSHKKRANVRITPGGLVVRSGGLNPEGGRDHAPKVGRDMHEPSLVGRNGDRPEVLTRILGTLMPPARQMV